MDFLNRIAAEPLVLLIPVFSAAVGWFTNVLAVRMMFYPTEFVGVRPFLGWQGLVPANAEHLARMSTHLILTKLLSLKELFASFKGEEFAPELNHVIDDITSQVIDEVATKRAPQMWANAGEFMQNKVRDTLRQEIRTVVIRILDDFGDNITDILDLEKVVVEAVLEDRGLMSLMFLEVGNQEFKFIERSGIWFGALFGLVQMTIWVYYKADFVLPAAGFFVGYATNWVALKLIFHPKQPKRVGPLVLHGVFHKRQHEVAARFSGLTATKVLNADNITKTITQGATAERIGGIVEHRVNEVIDKHLQHPMAAMVLPEPEREPLRQELLGRIRDELPQEGGLLHTFAAKSIDIGHEINHRMQQLPPEEFEGVLRPAFQTEEWKLILAGALLGLGAGVVQWLYVFT